MQKFLEERYKSHWNKNLLFLEIEVPFIIETYNFRNKQVCLTLKHFNFRYSNSHVSDLFESISVYLQEFRSNLYINEVAI